jgi:hypothetical protein
VIDLQTQPTGLFARRIAPLLQVEARMLLCLFEALLLRPFLIPPGQRDGGLLGGLALGGLLPGEFFLFLCGFVAFGFRDALIVKPRVSPVETAKGEQTHQRREHIDLFHERRPAHDYDVARGFLEDVEKVFQFHFSAGLPIAAVFFRSTAAPEQLSPNGLFRCRLRAL